jgi:hypothetical protein
MDPSQSKYPLYVFVEQSLHKLHKSQDILFEWITTKPLHVYDADAAVNHFVYSPQNHGNDSIVG